MNILTFNYERYNLTKTLDTRHALSQIICLHLNLQHDKTHIVSEICKNNTPNMNLTVTKCCSNMAYYINNKRNSVILHILGSFLRDGEAYSFFIRAWFDEKTFSVFKSHGVVIQTLPPETSNIFGEMVRLSLYIYS